MNITRFNQAPEYKAPNHFDMTCLRLQGHEAGPSKALWMGVSQIQPGGHTGLDGSPMEKHYVVLSGEVTLVSELNGVITEAVLKVHSTKPTKWPASCWPCPIPQPPPLNSRQLQLETT
ncbi:MAG: hypothetical protein RL650_2405 [Pseudomonadota bacterium]